MRSKKEIRFADKLKRTGLAFDTNVRGLPGSPDIVFGDRKVAVFYHGCFWHGHHCRTPPSSYEWRHKITGVKERDKRVQASLRAMGFRVIVYYECEVDKDPKKIISKLQTRLSIVPPL